MRSPEQNMVGHDSDQATTASRPVIHVEKYGQFEGVSQDENKIQNV
jgi:hypothetical protein